MNNFCFSFLPGLNPTSEKRGEVLIYRGFLSLEIEDLYTYICIYVYACTEGLLNRLGGGADCDSGPAFPELLWLHMLREMTFA